MEARDVFPVFSQLHETTDKSAAPAEKPRPHLLPFAGTKTKTTKKRRPAQKRSKDRDSFESPYECSGDALADARKTLLSLALLLESSSSAGNRDVPGMLANGLSFALKQVADDVRFYLFTVNELVEAGGDPRKVRR